MKPVITSGPGCRLNSRWVDGPWWWSRNISNHTTTRFVSRTRFENRHKPPEMIHLRPVNGYRSRFLGRGSPLRWRSRPANGCTPGNKEKEKKPWALSHRENLQRLYVDRHYKLSAEKAKNISAFLQNPLTPLTSVCMRAPLSSSSSHPSICADDEQGSIL